MSVENPFDTMNNMPQPTTPEETPEPVAQHAEADEIKTDDIGHISTLDEGAARFHASEEERRNREIKKEELERKVSELMPLISNSKDFKTLSLALKKIAELGKEAMIKGSSEGKEYSVAEIKERIRNGAEKVFKTYDSTTIRGASYADLEKYFTKVTNNGKIREVVIKALQNGEDWRKFV